MPASRNAAATTATATRARRPDGRIFRNTFVMWGSSDAANVPTHARRLRTINCRHHAPFTAHVRRRPTPRGKLAGSLTLRRHGTMTTRKGSLWLAVAAAVLLPAKAKARGRAEAAAHRDEPVQKQSRR